MDGNNLNIAFMGGRHAGVLGLLICLSKRHSVIACVPYTEDLRKLSDSLRVPVFRSITDAGFLEKMQAADILLSVHGLEILSGEMLALPKAGSFNVHPYLSKYKGAKPVNRALADGDFKASVGVHQMVEEIDGGEVLLEYYLDVGGAKSVEEIYNRLYPLYVQIISDALDKIAEEKVVRLEG